MKIADIDLGERPLLLAPMEDVTDPSFRLICREHGADMVYTEFVSADALIRNINSTTRKLFIDPRERPAAIQIYGREPEPMVEAARIAEQAHPDILDINFGCPVKKVAGKGAGAGLLRDVPKMCRGRCCQGAGNRKDSSRMGRGKQNHRNSCRAAAGLWNQSSHNPWSHT